MDLLEVMQKRRSVRAYTDQSIPMDTLEKVIQAGFAFPHPAVPFVRGNCWLSERKRH